jgi:membrane protease subunit HflK
MSDLLKPPEFNFRIPALRFGAAGIVIVLIAAAILLYTSIYTIAPNERGVVLRFGRYSKTTDPGIHLKIPFGVDRVEKVKVDLIYKQEFGFRTKRAGRRTEYEKSSRYTEESLMLTGDLNIADVEWVVQFRIRDPKAFLFNVRDVPDTIRDLAESAMRELAGDHSFHEVIRTRRIDIENQVRVEIQTVLDQYDTGVALEMVKLQDVHPPDPVKPSFNEVNRARQQMDQSINEGNRTFNKEVYRAHGEAQKILSEAEGYAADRVNRSRGDAERFTAVWREYNKAQDVTRKRLYLETMRELLPRLGAKYVVDEEMTGILPLLQLDGQGAAGGKP